MKLNGYLLATLTAGALTSGSSAVNAAVITVDGTVVTKLSAAVTAAQLADDGPHTINITAAFLEDDAPVYITEPMTINGNASATDPKGDILVRIAGLRSVAAPSASAPERAYITIQTVGNVEINNLQIHPDLNGADKDEEDVTLRVDGVRCLKPLTTGAGSYVLKQVFISGSDDAGNYIPLTTGEDIYTTAKKWSYGGTGNSVVQFSNQGSPGTYAATLDHCHIGLGQASAVNSPVTGTGQRRILGGLFGHCGTDGIRVSGNNFRIIGTSTDRVRVVRSTNISGGDAHAVEAAGGGIPVMNYVDIACYNTANGIKTNGSSTVVGDHIRILGKYNEGNNAALYVSGSGNLTLTNSTFMGFGNNFNPFQSDANFTGTASFTDCIFTSENLGQLVVNRPETGTFVPTFAFSAIPTDNVTSESLNVTTPITGIVTPEIVLPPNTVTVSPQYMLTLEDYDWTENQGAGQAGNGAGNINVLRPSNPAYAAASSTASNLNGGAGAAPASISSDIWMLMQ